MVIGWVINTQMMAQSTVVTESITLTSDSSTTVLDWFKRLENHGFTLSYNTSAIDLKEKVSLKQRTYSVEDFLKSVLFRYHFETIVTSHGKILLQIKGLKQLFLRGYVTDQETSEPLEGCTIQLKLANGKKYTALTDSLGVFSLRLPYGSYQLNASYIGYKLFSKDLVVDKSTTSNILLSQEAIPLKEVKVSISPLHDEVNYKGASHRLSVNANDPFSQINSLPGVSGSTVTGDLYVNGGQNDENLILLDGVSVYHSHHNNALLAQFNGESVEKVSFFDGFIPAQYEGRLSSVTDVRIKEGNRTDHHQSIGLDLPSASLTLDGPIIKNKLTYMISGRHSWIDLMKDLFSDNPGASRTFNDVTVKLKYQLNQRVSVEGLMYRSRDSYNDSIDYVRDQRVLEWRNNLYSLTMNAQLPKSFTNSTTFSYSEYENRIFAPVINIQSPVFIGEGMRNINIKSSFSKKIDEYLDLSWGLSASEEKYNLLASKDTVENATQHVVQFSSFVNSKLKITDKLYGSAALNLVSYLPENSASFFSIQPRFMLKYIINQYNTLSVDFSRMEQFYHTICMGEIPIPTDFRMPSVHGFKPSSSIHGEIGWKYINDNHRLSVSTYYKRRFDILGIRYTLDADQQGWDQLIMDGDASSYGFKVHSLNQWNKWMLELSYTFSRSYEWFRDFENGKKNPTLHDIPHLFNCAASYQIGKKSYLSVGGYVKSGTIENILYDDFSSLQIINGRRRKNTNYRLDLNFASSISPKSQRCIFSYKVGLYNIVGNPKRNEIIDLYSVETNNHCLPYFTLNLKF